MSVEPKGRLFNHETWRIPAGLEFPSFYGSRATTFDFIVIIVGAIISMKIADQAKPEFVCTAVK